MKRISRVASSDKNSQNVKPDVFGNNMKCYFYTSVTNLKAKFKLRKIALERSQYLWYSVEFFKFIRNRFEVTYCNEREPEIECDTLLYFVVVVCRCCRIKRALKQKKKKRPKWHSMRFWLCLIMLTSSSSSHTLHLDKKNHFCEEVLRSLYPNTV